MPKEEGDVIREYNASHEENLSSSWLRKELLGKESKVNEKCWRSGRKQNERDGEKKVCQL